MSVVHLLSCVRFCDPRDCSMPGLPVLYCPPGFALTHVHWVGDAIQPSHLLLPLLLLSSIFTSIRAFSNESVLCIKWQNIGASASASVLPMNNQCWFPLGLTGFILLSKGLSRVFVNLTLSNCVIFLKWEMKILIKLWSVSTAEIGLLSLFLPFHFLSLSHIITVK